MSWATAAEVLAMTGETVAEEKVALASAMVDTYTGADEDLPEDAISPKDRRHLKKATIWQAIWIPNKPGLLTHRENSPSTTADSVVVTRAAPVDGMLAPMAIREIKSLSWVGTRTILVPPAPRGLPPGINFLSERADRFGSWNPL